MKKIYAIMFLIFIGVQFIPAQTITVNSPAPGVTWYKGDTRNITWTSSGCSSPNVKINIFRNSISQANFVEQLTGPDSGTKKWTIPAGYMSGNYVLRIKADPPDPGCQGDSSIFVIADKMTFAETPGQTTMMKGVFYRKPDLEISIIAFPESPDVNQKTLVEFKVKNIGEGNSQPTKMRAFKAVNNTDTWDVPALEKGRFFYKTKEITPEGPGYILWSADVDQDNRIGDTNRSNNYASKKMIINGPDLVVCFMNSIRPELAKNETIPAHVRNNGSAKSTPCKLRFYMEQRGVETINVPALNPGEVFSTSRKEKWYTMGHKTISLTIDSEGSVPEENEKNNHIEGSVRVFDSLTHNYALSNYICSNGKSGPTMESVW